MGNAVYKVGDVFEVMATMPDASVDLVLTSPPFLALRSYLPADHPDKTKEIGSEPTPAAYLDTLLALTAEWRRLLAPHGSICIELGDTYAGSGGAGGDYNPGGLREGQDKFEGSGYTARQDTKYPKVQRDGMAGGGITNLHGKIQGGGPGWPLPKSLCGIPTLYAWSLAYGRNLLTGTESPAGQWRVRNLVVWCRPNPPVGALGDKFRPATSYLTVACVGAKRYFDLDAVRGPAAIEGDPRHLRASNQITGSRHDDGTARYPGPAGAPPLDYWVIPDVFPGFDPPAPPPPKSGTHRRTAKGVESVERTGKSADRGGNWSSMREQGETAPAPPLDYWEIPTHPYPGAHYATWPPALCSKPIEAMCPRRVCVVCGKASKRITSVEYESLENPARNNVEPKAQGDGSRSYNSNPAALPLGRATKNVETLGWTDCGHNNWRPGHTLDPFAGSGTTLAVATGHGRNATGIDLDERNYWQARERIGLFLEDDNPPRPIADLAPHNPLGPHPYRRAGFRGQPTDYGQPA